MGGYSVLVVRDNNNPTQSDHASELEKKNFSNSHSAILNNSSSIEELDELINKFIKTII